MPSGSDLELLVTGSAALDGILGGGIPVRSANVIADLPGTGKTLCAIQMLFHFAREGRKSLYFTTISEPAVKLLRYIQCFAFFDELLLDEFIRFVEHHDAEHDGRGSGDERDRRTDGAGRPGNRRHR